MKKITIKGTIYSHVKCGIDSIDVVPKGDIDWIFLSSVLDECLDHMDQVSQAVESGCRFTLECEETVPQKSNDTLYLYDLVLATSEGIHLLHQVELCHG